jgi:diguanylate cyclase (GGDEF)-like protein
MKAPMNANEGGPTWLCSSAAERERLLDMEERIKPVRSAAFGLLAVALLICGPWVGWWTLLPLAIAGLGFALVDRFLERTCHPEFPMAAAWILAQLVIAASVALTGGPDAASVAWLVIPVCTLPARYGTRGVTAGVLFSGALMVIVTLGVDPSVVLAHPEKLAFPLAMLGAVALLSVALMRSDVEHRSEAVIDPLTGMLNRNALTTRTAELAQQAAVVNQPVALIVGDLDRFKSVNDGHGHAAGDAVLKDVAYRIRKQLRAYDLAYRLGGEEFLVVVPGADCERATAIAEDLRRAISDAPSAGLLVTISFGVSASRPGEFDYEVVFAEADLALYEAKKRGRDQVCARAHDGAGVMVPAYA